MILNAKLRATCEPNSWNAWLIVELLYVVGDQTQWSNYRNRKPKTKLKPPQNLCTNFSFLLRQQSIGNDLRTCLQLKQQAHGLHMELGTWEYGKLSELKVQLQPVLFVLRLKQFYGQNADQDMIINNIKICILRLYHF